MESTVETTKLTQSHFQKQTKSNLDMFSVHQRSIYSRLNCYCGLLLQSFMTLIRCLTSDIQWRVEALEETQKECNQLLTEELEENRSGVALFKKIEAPFNVIEPLTTVTFLAAKKQL